MLPRLAMPHPEISGIDTLKVIIQFNLFERLSYFCVFDPCGHKKSRGFVVQLSVVVDMEFWATEKRILGGSW